MADAKPRPKKPNILVVDVGGTNVKLFGTGFKEPIKIPSGPTLTPKLMMQMIKTTLKAQSWDAVSIGYPGPVVNGRPLSEPHNLAPGWVGFDFHKAFGCP